jgi:flavorubredoxin
MSILPLSENVKWIGILDPDLVTFDIVMETRFGTTYNSYFINADKKAIIETVKYSFRNEFINKIKQLCNPSEVEYIILNHTEPDHSGSLETLLELAPDATIVGSGQAINNLQEMLGKTFKSLKVKDGAELSLGNMTLRFIGAPNLHWPDSMYTYLIEEKILFTCDSFGAHYCNSAMYDDLVGNYDDALRYYFNVILKPFSKFMLKAIAKIRPLEIKAIGTGHGPILRSGWKQVVDITEKLASEYMESIGSEGIRILIAYVSAYGYTREMALNIAEGLRKTCEAEIDIIDLERVRMEDLEEKIIRSNAIIIGSPTINQNTLLPIFNLLSLINPIRDKGKIGASFGSFGWSGEAVKIIDSNLRSLKLEVPFEGLIEKFYPHSEKALQLAEFGSKLGEIIKARARVIAED